LLGGIIHRAVFASCGFCVARFWRMRCLEFAPLLPIWVRRKGAGAPFPESGAISHVLWLGVTTKSGQVRYPLGAEIKCGQTREWGEVVPRRDDGGTITPEVRRHQAVARQAAARSKVHVGARVRVQPEANKFRVIHVVCCFRLCVGNRRGLWAPGGVRQPE